MGRYLELAIKALKDAAGNEQAVEKPATSPLANLHPERLADCGCPHCAGCYEIEPGVRIHPPKTGQEYLDWLKRWEAKGRVQ